MEQHNHEHVHLNKSHQNEVLLENEFLKLLSACQGHFQLESGHHGNLWLDLDQLFLRPTKLHPFIAELAKRIAAFDVAAVCGPMVGGGLIAQMIASELDIEFYYAERLVFSQNDGISPVKYRIPGALRERLHGKSVALVDDVINAGSATRGTLTDLLSCGATPAVIGALLILGDSMPKFFMEKNLPFTSIATLQNEIWKPEACPLCASDIPLEDVNG